MIQTYVGFQSLALISPYAIMFVAFSDKTKHIFRESFNLNPSFGKTAQINFAFVVVQAEQNLIEKSGSA